MTQHPAAGDEAPAPGKAASDALILGALIFACSLFGIYSAPSGLLAAFWPANAVMLGVLVRRARPATPLDWFIGSAAYILADLFSGEAWLRTILLSGTNLVGIATGYLLFARMKKTDTRLLHPRSMLRFVFVVATAAAGSGVAGMVSNPLLVGGTVFDGFTFWFTTELVNYIALLPALLTMPDITRWLKDHRRRADWPSFTFNEVAPICAFGLSLWLGTQLGGPGVIPYPIPAMLWCALTYSLFTTAGITLFFCMWTLLAISSGYLSIGAAVDTQQAIMSLRVGVTLTALAPLTVASVMVARNELLERLKHAATHDYLTHVLNRNGFLIRVEALLSAPHPVRQQVAVLMLDIDHFKRVNDSYGHAAGDLVLASFARLTQECLRSSDVLGRLGGEEFAVLLPDCNRTDARLIAQRICDAFAQHSVQLDDGTVLGATVSIGVCCEAHTSAAISTMLSAADAALYKAKEQGRNRVELALPGKAAAHA
ncbi:MAG: diguanylate cyclase [Pseudomonadota bacterium]